MQNSEHACVDTEVLTLEKIFNGKYQFSIPSYQRPYVWPDEAVLKLLADINDARMAGENNYFIGTVLSSIDLNINSEKVYELIDGQQRTTTLMLIALAFKSIGVEGNLAQVAGIQGKPRLQFSIRAEVQHLLGAFIGLSAKDYPKPSDDRISNNPYLTRIDAALTVLKQQVSKLQSENPSECDQLAQFIFEKVQWVNNILPRQMDLNKLFATMNTAGIQLEQTDILKSKLLSRISTNKPLYDAIWVACEHLENYFERNLRKVFVNAPWNELTFEDLAYFKAEKFVVDKNGEEKGSGFTIAQIDQGLRNIDTSKNVEAETDYGEYDLEVETVYCRSIISFSLLLIHTYRIYLSRKEGAADIKHRVHSDKLIEIFEPLTKADESEVIAFFELLWQVRFQFDRWVVKWVEHDDSKDKKLSLTNQS